MQLSIAEINRHAQSSPLLQQDLTLVDILRLRAELQQDVKVFSYLANGEEETQHFTFGALDERARSVAVRLKDAGAVPGDRILLVFAPGIGFIEAFYGCLYAGMIAVPIKAPTKRQTLQHIERIVSDCTPALVLTDPATTADLTKRAAELHLPRQVRWLTLEETNPGTVQAMAGRWQRPGITGDSLAFLQYTSGSTSQPKGVCVGHRNIISNMQMINEAFGHNEHTVMVGWLPTFHDMGLVGNVMQPVYNGFLSVLMPPMAFLQKPMRWLRAISAYRATSSGGPNFGFDLCIRKHRPEQLEGVDLSSWKVAYNGAEPVRGRTLHQFAATFRDYGFRASALHPCYGMAETTLIATGGWIDDPPKTIVLHQDALEKGCAIPLPHPRLADRPGKAVEMVRCGRPLLSGQVKIVDPSTGRVLPAGRVGEIWISGPHVASGYWNKQDTNRQIFGQRLEELKLGGFLRTGDLGFMIENELYVCGRLKDTIIINGRNLFPQELEAQAENSHPGFVTNGAVAFEYGSDEESRLVLVMEVNRSHRNAADHSDLLASVRSAIASQFDVPVADLVLIDEMTLPKTSSGKLRRGYCRELYREGKLAPVGKPELQY